MSPTSSDPTLSADAIAGVLRAAGSVFAEDEAQLLIESASSPDALVAMVSERVAGVPLEHVVGWAEFCGLRIAIDSGVFVPRRRSELLARRAAELCRPGGTTPRNPPRGWPGGRTPRNPPRGWPGGTTPRNPPRGPVVIDLACGSGAIGAAIATLAADVELHAVDIDPAAAACARRNLEPVGGQVYVGDLYEPLPGRLRGRVSVIAANVPYVPTEAVALMPREARGYESLVALDGGPDGLDVLRRAAFGACGWLMPGGHVLIETASGQADTAAAAFTAAGLAASVTRDEELGATVVIGRL
jgi:release factor glutamine methyltransferase